ncbi:F-box domain-containing protein [Mycena indigotica]|uniref:F-box domain-containing protein n=1 Tax=Mycena indigotica TaxID=2126181 RepID=A0A8H6S6V9_9AGAR|nr:F-box domain-containing protein [Mycena indigotica]KAF7292902.1 F-box domain-containing protein [Mycena indigotica]
MSRFPSSKLGTNYSPSDSEIAHIHSLLAQPTSRFIQLSEQIAELETERATLKSFIDSHRALLSPIRRVPVEILHRVFLECLPNRGNCVMSTREAPLLLTRVCSGWRRLVQSSPALWSSLHIHLPTQSSNSVSVALSEKITRRLEGVKYWLAFANQCPLSLSVSSTRWRGQELMDILISHAHHWAHFAIQGPPNVLMPLQRLTLDQVPQLESVLVQPTHGDSDDGTLVPHGYLTSWESVHLLQAPHLRRVVLFDIPLGILPQRWENIVDLAVERVWSITTSNAVEILSLCVKLAFFRLWVREDHDESDDPHKQMRVEHRSLVVFHLILVGSIDITLQELSQALALPKLQDFRCQAHGSRHRNIANSLEPLGALLVNSRELDICEVDADIYPNRDSLLEFLHMVPEQLHVLMLTSEHSVWSSSRALVDNQVLKAFFPTDKGGYSALQSLEKIVFRNCTSFTELNLVDFLNARKETNNKLRRLQVHWTRERSFGIADQVRQSQGNIEVELIYPPEPDLQKITSPWQGLEDLYALGWDC